eukprot:gene14047-biopygen6584
MPARGCQPPQLLFFRTGRRPHHGGTRPRRATRRDADWPAAQAALVGLPPAGATAAEEPRAVGDDGEVVEDEGVS